MCSHFHGAIAMVKLGNTACKLRLLHMEAGCLVTYTSSSNMYDLDASISLLKKKQFLLHMVLVKTE